MEFLFLLTGSIHEVSDQFGNIATDFVGKLERFEQGLFGNLLGTGFDHDDRAVMSDHCQVEVVLLRLELRPGRIDAEFFVDQTNPASPEDLLVRNGTDCQSSKAGNGADDFRFLLEITRKNE